jgi:hypothetical protein
VALTANETAHKGGTQLTDKTVVLDSEVSQLEGKAHEMRQTGYRLR